MRIPARLPMFFRPGIAPARGRVIPEVSPRFHRTDGRPESVELIGADCCARARSGHECR